MKCLLVLITFLAPVFGVLAENNSAISSTVQLQDQNTGNPVIEIGSTESISKKSSPLFALIYIIPSVMVLLIVILSIALSKRLLFEQ
jgi:hypothetical protein